MESILSLAQANTIVVATVAAPVISGLLAMPLRWAYRRGKRAALRDFAKRVLPEYMSNGRLMYGFDGQGNVVPNYVPITKSDGGDNAPVGNRIMKLVLDELADGLPKAR